jgi:dCTP deaminase
LPLVDPLGGASGLLPDWMIEQALDAGEISIEPYNAANTGPCSVDLTLGPEFLVPRPLRSGRPRAEDPDGQVLLVDPANPGTEPLFHPVLAPTSFTIRPGEFILASTREQVTLGRQYAARLEGKSSLARLGISPHVTAGWIDPGFSGTITLEIINSGPWLFRLRPGMKIGQLCFLRLPEPVRRPYGSSGLQSRYQGAVGPVPSRIWNGFSCDDARTSGKSVL